jgi:hypothetical protein
VIIIVGLFQVQYFRQLRMASLFTLFYVMFLMSYSGSMFVQISYWLLETYLLEEVDVIYDSFGFGDAGRMAELRRRMQRLDGAF